MVEWRNQAPSDSAQEEGWDMAETAPASTKPTPARIRFPEVVDVVKFTLEIAGSITPATDDLAAQVRRALSEEFAKCDPLLATLYELEIEETEVWEGSRKSRNRGRLKRRHGGGLIEKLKRAGGTALIVLTLASTDYKKIPENFEIARQKVEQTYHVVIKDVQSSPLHFRPPLP
jgi:hypothetical protein